MNSKVYRLLRNNKEQGPFTLQELVEKTLKPFDLVWIDGRSAAWSYPAELAELKMYVEDKTEKLFLDLNTRQNEAAVKSVALNVVSAEMPKQKPRYKVSAAWSKIQTVTTPLYNNVAVAEPKKISAAKIIDIHKTQPPVSKSLSWEQAWLDWEIEKKSVPLKNHPLKIRTVNTEPKIQQAIKSAPVLEKKFEQSLDTITNNYIDNILQQKKKSKNFQLGKVSEFVIPSLALIIIFSIAYWLMHDTKVPSLKQVQPVPQQSIKSAAIDEKTNAASTFINNNQHAAKISDNSNNKQNTIETPVKQKLNNNYIAAVKFVPASKTNIVSGKPIPQKNIQQTNAINAADINLKKNVTASAAKQFDPVVINNVPEENTYNGATTANGDLNAVETRPVKRRTNTDVSNNSSSDQPASTASPIKPANTKSGLNYVSVPEYISMNDGNGSIKIQNVSDVDLDLAVIDVQYFDASGRFRKGETMYLHNLKAGKTVILNMAKDVNSAYATSKVSLVSSDANGVYAVGDN